MAAVAVMLLMPLAWLGQIRSRCKLASVSLRHSLCCFHLESTREEYLGSCSADLSIFDPINQPFLVPSQGTNITAQSIPIILLVTGCLKATIFPPKISGTTLID